uniref:Uncharacterized protein n=1 Tax=Oryza punctata TaxID=4537 RepID=A0A0E0M8P4_ORYPU
MAVFRLDPRVDQIQEMKSPASSHQEQPWLSSVYGSPVAIGGSNRFEYKRENVENVLAHPVLTKQRNGDSKVQGAAETMVVGQRRQNSDVDVGWSAARTGVCRCFWCFGLGNKEEWSGGVREMWLVHSLCSLGIHWAWGTVDAVRGEWEAFMWGPRGVGPTVSERNSKIALEAKSKRVACQGSLEAIQGGFCAARNLG